MQKIIKLTIFSILIFILVIFFIGLNKDPMYNTKNLIGTKLKDINLIDVDLKKSITDKDIAKNNYTLINFWASWCSPCKAEIPALLKLKDEKNLIIIGVNFKDKKKNALNFLEKFGNPFNTIAFDNKGKQSINFGVYGIPESILVDKELTIIKKFIGPISKSDYEFIKKKIENL